MIATLAPSWHDDQPQDLRCHCWDHRGTYLLLHLVLTTCNSSSLSGLFSTLYFLVMFPIIYHNGHQDDCHDCISLYIILYIIHIFSSHFIILITGCFPQYHGFDLPYHRICPKRYIGAMSLQETHVANVNCPGREETNGFWQ